MKAEALSDLLIIKPDTEFNKNNEFINDVK